MALFVFGADDLDRYWWSPSFLFFPRRTTCWNVDCGISLVKAENEVVNSFLCACVCVTCHCVFFSLNGYAQPTGKKKRRTILGTFRYNSVEAK